MLHNLIDVGKGRCTGRAGLVPCRRAAAGDKPPPYRSTHGGSLSTAPVELRESKDGRADPSLLVHWASMTLLPTTVVGSYPQPDWLVDRENLRNRLPPRVRAREMWRVAETFLEAAQDDATLLAIREMERAGVDILTDGEIRRESYSNRFA